MRHPRPIPYTPPRYAPPTLEDNLALERQAKGLLQRLAAARGIKYKFVEVRKVDTHAII